MAAPVINLTTSGAKGLTNVSNAESTTSFSGFRHSGGGTPSPGDEANVFVQGTQAVSIKVSGSTRDEGIYYTAVGGVDMTTDANKHVHIWAAMTDMAQLDGIEAGGFFIIAGSSASDWNKFYVAGSDTIDGRFVRYVLDVTKVASESSGTPDMTAVTHLGVGCKAASITGKAENLVLDRIDYGTGWQIEEGDSTTPGSWEEAFQIDNLIDNKFGILQKEPNGTYTLTGGITFGDPAGTVSTLWEDATGAIVKFKNPLYYNGTALVSSIDGPSLYALEVLGNGTGTTNITFGAAISTGDDRQGLNGGFLGTDGPKWSWDSKTDIADIETVNFYGMTFQGAGITLFDILLKTEIIGCTFTNCGEIKPTLTDWVNNQIVAPVPDRGIEIVASSNVKNTTCVSGISGPSDTRSAIRCWQVDISVTPDAFVEYTDEFNSAATGDVIPFPPTEASGDYFAIGSDRLFRAVTVDVGTARSGGTVNVQYFDGSVWPLLILHVDDTNGLSTTGPQLTRWEVPDDWVKTSLNGEEPLFYMRFQVGTIMSTNPVIDEGDITEIEEHLLHYPVAAGEDADGLVCFGGAVHVENSDASTTEDSYAFSNQSGSTALGAATALGRGQSFTGAGGVLSSVLVEMSKNAATDVADITCRVYAHSGTFGVSSVPTGPALAVANVVSTAAISELGLRQVKFEFEDKATLVNLTNYCVTWEVVALFGSGQVNIGVDGTSPVHGGNAMFLVGTTWTASTIRDYPFFVQSGAILELSLINGSVISTDDNTNALPGATILVNNLSITLVDLIVNTEVRVYLQGTSTEVDGVESSGASFGFSIGTGIAVDYVILGPIVGNLAYVPIRQENISWTDDTVIVISQQIEPDFNNP